MTSLFEQTNLLLDKNFMTHVCNRMMNASSIDIYGIGITGTIAQQMAFQFQSIGLSWIFHNDFNEAYIYHIP